MTTLRRYAPMKKSAGTTWPQQVREHVRSHYAGCYGPLAGMPGYCSGQSELDHIRASHGTSMKSDSIAVNAAPMCSFHHRLKTEAGKTWRPRLLDVVRAVTWGCAECDAEHLRVYGLPLHDGCPHVDPVHGCAFCRERTKEAS